MVYTHEISDINRHMSSYKLPSHRPFDLSVVVTLILALVLPLMVVGFFGLLSNKEVAQASYRPNSGVMIPSEDEMYQTYKDNVAYTTMLAEKESRSSVLGVTTTNASEQPLVGDSKQLAVPFKKQIYTLSCEVANVEMILNYFGSSAETQDSLMTKLGYAQPIAPQVQGDKMTWADPNEGFVGKVDGYMVDKNRGLIGATGWGVNKAPVAKLLQRFYPKSYAGTGSIAILKSNLAQDRPVIFWHVRDDAFQGQIQYSTPTGKIITLKQNHVALLTGYKMEANGQTIYTVADPLFGEYTISEADLLRIWGKYDFDMVVAVR
jgi:uncharacterized protein YvpB